MSRKKIKPCKDWKYLPKEVRKSTKRTINEKNIIAVLCKKRLEDNKYALEHDGWFHISQKDIAEGSMLGHTRLNELLNKLEANKVFQRKAGTNHHETHYKLHPKIEELLPL